MQISSSINDSEMTLVLAGKLTVNTTPDLEAAIGQAPPDVCDIYIDLEELDYVSSAGLRIIVAASKLASSRGGTLRLLKPQAEVMDVFDMTGLSEILTIE